MEARTRTVTITLTESCNLRCSYCYENHKSQKRIDLETAKKIVDAELSISSDYDSLEFDLFGGEPFLEFDLIRKITEYICERRGNIPCTIFATTNGTLVHGDIQKWLLQHKGCFVCGLSLDGTREMHNINRSNSYDDIDIAFFAKTYPDQDVKMTISEETLPFLADGVIEMHQKGFLVSCNLAYGIDWSSRENTGILERELNKLIDFYLNHPSIQPCSMLDMGISNIAMEETQAIRFCGAGKHMKAYDVDGRAYPCQFFMPLSVGEEKAQQACQIAFPNEVMDESNLDEKCRSCILRPSCPNCFGANYAATGNIYRRDENMCKLTKIILKARSFFRAKQWEKGQLKGNEDEIMATLKAAVRIQEELHV